MLARLILALLLAVFAVPVAAPAACHEAPAMRAMVREGAHEAAPMREHKATAPHGCIGCVPPSTWIAARPAPPPLPAPIMRIARAERLDLGEASPPALPPPRAT